MRAQALHHLLGFVVVGSVGFAVDGGVLTLLTSDMGVNAYAARLVSFPVALLTTWLLNRTLVFPAEIRRGADKRLELGKYFLVQAGGALVNLCAFSAVLMAYPALHAIPVAPLAVGSACGLVFNFAGARYWVFRVSTAKSDGV